MKTFNEWFTGLPEEEQKVLREDKWMLAERAYKEALKSKTDGGATVPCSDRVMPNHDQEPEHVENENCWCKPIFDTLANRWSHNLKVKGESKAILTHSAHG